MRPSANDNEESKRLQRCVGDSCIRLREKKDPAIDGLMEAIEKKVQQIKDRMTRANGKP